MRIYTGYYGNLKAYAGLKSIGISIGTPRWLPRMEKYPLLFPKRWMLPLEREPYTEAYRTHILMGLNPRAVLSDLERLSGGADVVLLCYEKPGDFCHRQLVAEWLRAKTGLEVGEYVALPARPPEPEFEEMRLF